MMEEEGARGVLPCGGGMMKQRMRMSGGDPRELGDEWEVVAGI